MNQLRKALGNHYDIAMVLFVMGILTILFAPIPSGLLDFLILLNFSFAFLVLLLTFYMHRPVEFSTFPSLLLIATLFRLSLNVAATRLILSDGNAGKVISAIGSYVVGGNYVIGLIVFLILIVVQYVVVTSGAQRVSEVAARFTLDGMPGQQMSIDADLNMGFIDQEEAQKRRKSLEKEATFYGAMDGASKFVKGDAIAGIIIMLINIIGGFVVGVMQQNMRWDQALKNYTLLTIGDGIVTQVPALVIAVGTGIIVTRSASDGSLSNEVLKQITLFPKNFLLVAFAMFGLMLLPGIPALPTMMLIILALITALVIYRNQKEEVNEKVEVPEQSEVANDDPYALLQQHPIEVNVGKNWAPIVSASPSVFMERIAAFRKQFVQEFGLVLPAVKFKEIQKLTPNQYEIHIDGVLAARGESQFEKILAIHPSGNTSLIRGEVTKEPTYGLPAVWIEESQRAQATASQYTLVDATTVLVTHLTEIFRRESATLLDRSEVEKILGRVKKNHTGLVEELIPTVLSVGDVQKVLQNLLKEKVSIRHIEAILETLIDAARSSKEIPYLTELVRHRLGNAICQSLSGGTSTLHVMTIDPTTESQLLMALKNGQVQNPGYGLVLEPKLAETFITGLARQTEKMMKNNMLPILLCSPELRRHMRILSERVVPHLRILSMAEIPQTIELKSFGIVNPHH